MKVELILQQDLKAYTLRIKDNDIHYYKDIPIKFLRELSVSDIMSVLQLYFPTHIFNQCFEEVRELIKDLKY